MIRIKDTLISSELIDEKFACDLDKCKGACCVQGDSGAPLEESEIKVLEDIYPAIRVYLRKEGVKAIEQQGTHIIDRENEPVTPLVEGKECAYAVFENGIARCGIEKAFNDGVISFQKPVSCHLYPVRIKKYRDFISVNYDRWQICDPARKLGKDLNITVFEFTRDALVRRFGKDWYDHLGVAFKQRLKVNNSNK